MKKLVIVAFCATARAPANADVTIEESSSNYELSGMSLDQIDESLHRNAPREGGEIIEGEIRDDLTWKLWSRPEGNACRIVKDIVTIKIDMLLPNWTDRDRAAPPARKTWQEYYDKLLAHEDGHKTIALNAAYAVDKLFHNTSASGPCVNLEAKLNHAAAEAVEEAEMEQERWDEDAMPVDPFYTE